MATKPSWKRISGIFEQALERPSSQREAWVIEACGADDGLRREVERLLLAHGRADGVLDQPAGLFAGEPLDQVGEAARPDEQIGPYRIISEIGRGGMGVVYKAEDPRLGRHVALKFLPPYLTANERAKQRLLVEARAASALDHPNICTIYDIAHTPDGRLFFAMAHYEGQTLGERMDSGLPAEEAIEIAIQIARGLGHAHESGVIHRDIKPSNVFLTSRSEVKILDFGLAKQGVLSLTDPGTRVGTLAYMSPEQAMGRPMDRRTDVWSLGVVLFEMLSGRTPFRGDYEQAILYAIVNEDFWRPAAGEQGLPGRSEEIVRRALEKNPDQRYPEMSEMLQDLLVLQGEVGGRSAEISLAQAPAVSSGAQKAESSRGLRAKSVGREKELAELRASFEDCSRGEGHVLCIAGEPGMGKTTLVEEFLSRQATEGLSCFVARGRCSERLAGAEAYLPILEALETLSQGDAQGRATRLMKQIAPTWYVQIAPVLAASDSSLAQVIADAKLASQERMKRELNSFLQELSRSRPVILFCDDLHWADISTVDLLSYLGSRCDSMRLLIVGSYRPSDLLVAKHPFLQVKRELQGRGLCRELSIAFLSEQDIASYLDLEFPGHRLPAYFASFIHSRTEGSPLFMVDLLRDLQHRSVIAQQEEQWVLAQSLPEIQRDLPESIRGMIEKKIERLEDHDRRIVTAAAIQGQEFDSATLSRVLAMDVGAVEERLEDLGRIHRFVKPRDEREFPDGTLTQQYSFVHALYQNALYDTLRTRQKISLSAKAAQALQAFYGDQSDEIAADLAYLFEAARQFEHAADHFLLATEKAAAVYANKEAVALARRAIANARKLQGEKGLRSVLAAATRLGQLHLTLSKLEDAVADFDMAEETAAELGDAEAQVNAICAAAQARFNLTRIDETHEHALRALEIARAADSEVATAGAELVLGMVRMGRGETVDAEESFRRSVPILQEKGPPLHALEAIGFAGLLQAWQLNYEEADRSVNWTLQRSRKLGVPYHTVMNLFVRGMARFNQGRLSEGLHDLEEGMRLAEQNDERYWLCRYPNTLGWAFMELQDFDKSLRLNNEGAKLALENGYGKPEAQTRVNLAQFYLALDEPGNALEHLDRAEEIVARDAWFRWRYHVRLKAEMGRYWLRRGDTRKAARLATEALEAAKPRKARKHMAWAYKVLGDIAVAEERFDDGRREYESALGVLRHHHCPVIEWKILLSAAEMASAYRDVPLAEHYRGRCQGVINALAESITDEKLRRQFLSSEAIRSVMA